MGELASGSPVRVTVVQSAPRIEDVDGNLAACIAHLERAAATSTDLVVFPECALSGYMLTDEQAARRCADTIPGSITDTLGETCERMGLHCVVGMLETDGPALYNAAVLMGPQGSWDAIGSRTSHASEWIALPFQEMTPTKSSTPPSAA